MVLFSVRTGLEKNFWYEVIEQRMFYFHIFMVAGKRVGNITRRFVRSSFLSYLLKFKRLTKDRPIP
jgi:hypothetical protein